MPLGATTDSRPTHLQPLVAHDETAEESVYSRQNALKHWFLLHPTTKILMRLKASLLVTASCMTLVLAMIGLLQPTTQQAINAESGTDALSLAAPLLQPPLAPSQSSANAKSAAESVDALLDRPSPSATETHETLNRRFSVDKSLDRVKQIDQALANARTATTSQPINRGKSAVAGNDRTNPGTQMRAHNWAGAVTGTLKKQDYEIKKLELALAQKQFKDGEIPKAALVQKQASYQKSAREFKIFLKSFRIAD